MTKHLHPSTFKSWDYWYNVTVFHKDCEFWPQEYFDYWHEDGYCIIAIHYDCWGWTH